MEFKLADQIKLLKPFSWLGYPLLVLLFIVVSSIWFVGGSGRIVDQLIAKNEEVAVNRQKKEALEARLTLLESANDAQLNSDLRTLVESMPVSKQPWVALSQLKALGPLGSFKGSGSQAIVVDYKLESMDKVQELLEKIESVKPLLAVQSVVYSSGRATLNILLSGETFSSQPK